MAPDFSQDVIKSSQERDSSSASGPARTAIVATRRGLVNRRDIISQVEFGAESPVGRIESHRVAEVAGCGTSSASKSNLEDATDDGAIQ